MIKNFLENISHRFVIVEKCNESFKNDCFGMEFCLPKSKKKSELIVKFKKFSDSIFPNVKGDISTTKDGGFTMVFEPFEIQICSSNDCNTSSDFLKWIDCFIKENPYSGGAEISFFNYGLRKKHPIISLRGCVLQNVYFLEGMPFISVKFFSYNIPEENS